MATDDDTLMRMPVRRSPSDILEHSRRLPKPSLVSEAEPDSRDDGGGPESFDPESDDYKAYGRAGNQAVAALRLIFKDGREAGCLYAHLDTATPGGCEFIPSGQGHGNLIRLRFAGQDGVVMVGIEGLRLRRVWELVMAHRTPWLHEMPTDVDFQGSTGEPVIKSFSLKSSKPGTNAGSGHALPPD